MLADLDNKKQQLELFNSDRWPHKPYCSEDLANGIKIRPLKTALQMPYIQANPPHLRVWSVFDIDRPGAAVAWEDARLPAPTWSATNKSNGHAHLCYGLVAPVLLEAEDARRAPMRYLAATEAALRARLDADQGYSGLITKNPRHPLWRVLYGPRCYELGELAEWLDLPKHLPKRGQIEEIGLGRNCALFDFLRHSAYRTVKRAKAEGQSIDTWRATINGRALSRNGDFPLPLEGREVWHVAKSVADWTWRRFDIQASDARFSALQAHRGRLGGIAKGVANEDRRVSARLMHAQGQSYQQIADALGVSRRSAIYWCK